MNKDYIKILFFEHVSYGMEQVNSTVIKATSINSPVLMKFEWAHPVTSVYYALFSLIETVKMTISFFSILCIKCIKASGHDRPHDGMQLHWLTIIIIMAIYTLMAKWTSIFSRHGRYTNCISMHSCRHSYNSSVCMEIQDTLIISTVLVDPKVYADTEAGITQVPCM